MPAVPLTPERLFRRLDALGIAHQTVSHPPVFTVAEAAAVRGQLPGGHCKSLFLRDKKGGYWLAVMLEERRIDLNKLAIRLAAPRFSFGAAADLEALLGVRPGSVTPFALVNDAAQRVTPVLDRAMLDHDPLNYHPLTNDRTTDRTRGSIALHCRLRASAAHRRSNRSRTVEQHDRTTRARMLFWH